MSIPSSGSLQLNGYPGLKFKVTNDKGVESYLVGTCHVVDQASIKDPDINKIMDKCSTLYTEMGNYVFLTSAQGSMQEDNHQYQHIPIRYYYDVAFTIAAWCRKIPSLSLDVSVPGNKIEETWHLIRKVDTDTMEKKLMNELEKEDPKNRVFLAWKSAHIEFVENRRRNLGCTEAIEREKHWAKTLVPHLQNTTQPICIAVGAFHVVGDGLLEIFSNAGLKIEWICPRPPASIPEQCARDVSEVAQALLPTPRSRL